MGWTIPDHKKSAVDALRLGLITGRLVHLAEVPEPLQSTQHQARVSAISVLHTLGGPSARVGTPWTSGLYQWDAAPPPSDGWGDGVAFGDRTRQADVTHLVGESNVVIDGLWFDGTDGTFQVDQANPTNSHVCVLLENCTDVTIRNVDFRHVGQPVAILGGSNITVEWCRVDGITGPSTRLDVQSGNFLQTVGAPTGVTVQDNKILGGDTEDIISGFSALGMVIQRNQIDGTGWTSDSGTGIILGDGGGADQTARDNTLRNPGQVGIAIAGGVNGLVDNNTIYSTAVPGANIAAYCNNYYPGEPFGGNTFSGNRAWYQREDGSLNGFWNPGGASDVGNVWNDATISPGDVTVVL